MDLVRCTVMRLLLLFVFLLSSVVSLRAQAAESMRIPFERQEGQVYTVEVVRESEERAGGQRQQFIRAETAVSVRVDAVGPATLRETWTLGPVAVTSEGGIVGAPLGGATAFGLVEGIVVVYEADSTGAPRQLLNPDPVRTALRGVIRADEERPGAFGRLDAVALREDFRARLADPAALADLVLGEPRLLHTVSGRVLTLGQPRLEQVERPSPLTSAPVLMTVTTRLDSLSADSSTAFVTWTADADREALVESVIAFLEASSPGQVDPSLVRDLSPTLALEERATFAVDLRAGWILRSTYIKTARVAGRERIERATFRTAPPNP